MKKLLKAALPLALVAGSVALVIVLATNRPAPDVQETTPAAMLVDTIEALASDGHFRVSAQGTVRPRTRTILSAEVAGRIVEISDNFVAGGFFEAGQMLARIDPSDYETALLEAEAELAAARATLSEEEARAEAARLDWRRMHGETREPAPLVLRLPQVAGAEARMQAAEASVKRAERNLERTRISLPYSGLVRQRDVDLGQYVTTGTELGVTFAIDSAEVRLALSDRDLAFLELPAPGLPVTHRPEVELTGRVAGRVGQWRGEVVRTEGVVDEDTRLTWAVVRVEDPYGMIERERSLPLHVGTFVDATIRGRSADGLVRLPRVALRDGGRVFVANGDDELEIRDVEVVRTTTNDAYVRNGLEPGDRIILTAIQAPVPGMALQVRTAVPQAPPVLTRPADADASDLEPLE